ncbi:Putative alpha/beta hydrolase-1, epoxide hydrolase [Septoria linicola]|uniref:Alpha/beta hydrolase-1, epoxide hydrolase n=1 Tax=Septoria linicola TaxID=215465 RepID=A0A9Q9ANM0_9PEZI|nr:putative alpha/beta hydrolase-1, epoxide hydrolase [Septoria linicola]USW52280.1 Putative alpha/beta hydrolase-1, epoxide hydrolase [Septoria linicola]
MADEVDPPSEIMAPKIQPSDIGSKVKREYIEVDSWTWSYLDAPAQGSTQKAVAVLIHGFPDQSLAWRYQFPLLTSLGIRTIALDCMGYGGTGASHNLRDYGFKAHADVVAAIAKKIGTHKVIIGGHDWGGATVYRVAQWYPDLISHIFSVCTSYAPPTKDYISTKTLSETILPQFGYQLQLGSPDNKIESIVNDEPSIRAFLKGMYGGRPSSNKKFMTPEHGIDLSILTSPTESIAPSPLFNEDEFSYYVQQFLKTGLHGPLNWYRTRKINYEDDLHLPAETRNLIKQPTLYILATRDSILTKAMSRNMEKAVPNLTRGEVPATHWALWHTPNETNAILKEWLEGVVLGGRSKL